MDLTGLGAVASLAGDVINRIWPDASEAEKNKLSIALTQMNAEMEIMRTQTAVNATEAASSSLLVAGWRPAIGWICAASLGYQYVLYPILLWSGMLVPNFVPPQPVVSDVLMELLFGMLGLAGLRTVEKLKGVKK
jgi:hypothetical protein